jgi:hypothetical protein
MWSIGKNTLTLRQSEEARIALEVRGQTAAMIIEGQ